MSTYTQIRYDVNGGVATVTLHRPEKMNAFTGVMMNELLAVFDEIDADDAVRAVIVTGEGRAFCAGYDLAAYAQAAGTNEGVQAMPWDPMRDYKAMKQNTDDFMALWRSYKPTICKVHGYAVAGGSDIALCADVDARAGQTVTGEFGFGGR